MGRQRSFSGSKGQKPHRAAGGSGIVVFLTGTYLGTGTGSSRVDQKVGTGTGIRCLYSSSKLGDLTVLSSYGTRTVPTVDVK